MTHQWFLGSTVKYRDNGPPSWCLCERAPDEEQTNLPGLIKGYWVLPDGRRESGSFDMDHIFGTFPSQEDAEVALDLANDAWKLGGHAVDVARNALNWAVHNRQNAAEAIVRATCIFASAIKVG